VTIVKLECAVICDVKRVKSHIYIYTNINCMGYTAEKYYRTEIITFRDIN
jgi:hypothetical protein